MKKIILTIIVVFSATLGMNAQIIIPIENWDGYATANNVHFKDVNNIFTKFLGTWEYVDGPHYFKITFYKQNKSFDGIAQYSDRIYSNFLYKLNGNTIYDTYTVGPNPTPFKSYVDGRERVILNNTKLNLSYQEPSTTGCERNKMGVLEVEHHYIGQTHSEQLIWARTDRNSGLPPYPCPSGTTPDTSAYQIPANMVLTKI